MRRTAAITTVLVLALLGGAQAQTASASVPTFSNCTKMNKVYPHGVGRSGAHDHVAKGSKPVTNFKVSTSIYNANRARDRDKDGVACEKH
jgi:hypothetical protein